MASRTPHKERRLPISTTTAGSSGKRGRERGKGKGEGEGEGGEEGGRRGKGAWGGGGRRRGSGEGGREKYVNVGCGNIAQPPLYRRKARNDSRRTNEQLMVRYGSVRFLFFKSVTVRYDTVPKISISRTTNLI